MESTYRRWVSHLYTPVNKANIISDNGFSTFLWKAIVAISDRLVWIEILGTICIELWIKIQELSLIRSNINFFFRKRNHLISNPYVLLTYLMSETFYSVQSVLNCPEYIYFGTVGRNWIFQILSNTNQLQKNHRFFYIVTDINIQHPSTQSLSDWKTHTVKSSYQLVSATRVLDNNRCPHVIVHLSYTDLDWFSHDIETE